ncbi:MAG: cation:proton antiporter [Gammaproteobacteria bacterium]
MAEGEISIVFSVFLIFTGAAILATIALYARQSMLIAYILLGMLLGPHALGLVKDVNLLGSLSHVGITLLLFLLGLNLHPQNLVNMFRQATLVTLISSGIFAICGYLLAFATGFNPTDALVIASTMMFSSTIIGLKLLPNTVLHHQHTGEIIISVLLLQDLIAILILLVITAAGNDVSGWQQATILILSLPALLLFAFLFSRYVLTPLLRRFDTIQEYIFLLAIGWCLGLAELSEFLGLSPEIGAFIAGIALATEPISRFIADNLRPLRDFFLIVFFFSLGAGFNPASTTDILLPACILAAVSLLVKPFVFKKLWGKQGETDQISAEIGVRLGQISEFSLLIIFLGLQSGIISERASTTVQLATILSFIVSSYYIVAHYPTPMGTNKRLLRD